MITGLLTLILLAAAGTAEASPDLDELLVALAPEEDSARLSFVERRSSPLLNEPLEVTGQLWRNRRGELVRQTVTPRKSTHTLTADMVIIDQPGRSPRNYSLGHIPELAVLYHGLSALLAGDADALRQRFEHELTQDDEGGWQLELEPRDASLAEAVQSLSLSGHDDQLERFVLSLADGETIETELVRQP